jgi:ribosomal protein S24E
MELKIISQEHKKLLSRDEYLVDVKNHQTPSHAALKEEIAKKIGKAAELIAIKNINQPYGHNDVQVKFYIYSSHEALKKIEKETQKKKAAAPAAAA